VYNGIKFLFTENKQQKTKLLQQKKKKKRLWGNAAALWPHFITTTEKPVLMGI